MSAGENDLAERRTAEAIYGSSTNTTIEWTLSSTRFDDMVKLIVQDKVLPVIFVPGIMGSNLMSNDERRTEVWRLDTTAGLPLGLARRMSFSGAATRQRLMHPARTAVDPRGAVPSRTAGSVSRKQQYSDERFWGEISEGSYHSFLVWLEDVLMAKARIPPTGVTFSTQP